MSETPSATEMRCPWCSAPLADAAAGKCPSCGAQLTSPSGAEPSLPGVTALDQDAILRARSEAGRTRGGVLGFLTGRDLPESWAGDPPESLAPPEEAVRREMLRLQLEAERADAVAESVALKADVLAARGIHVDQLAAEADTPPAEAGAESESAGQAPAGGPSAD